MKSLIILISTVFIFSCSSTQNLVLQKTLDGNFYFDDLEMRISLPDAWRQSGQKERHGSSTGYNFIRESIKDTNDVPILPFMGIMYEDVPDDLNVIMYSAVQRSNLPPFQIIEVIASDQNKYKLKYGLAYLAKYIDGNSVSHKIFIIHMTNNNGKGVQIIIDGTESVYDLMEKEYINIIDSIKLD